MSTKSTIQHQLMTNDLTSDIELLAMMKSAAFTTDNPAYLHFLNDPSVQARIEVLFVASECKEVDIQLLQFRTFLAVCTYIKNMEKKVEKAEKQELSNDSLLKYLHTQVEERITKRKLKHGEQAIKEIYVFIFRNLLEAEPIRIGEEPQSGQTLSELYKSEKVIKKINRWLDDGAYKHIDPEEILSEGFKTMCDKIDSGEFRGESSLNTFLISICEKKVIALGRKKADREITDKIDLKDFNVYLNQGEADPFDFLGEDFHIGREQRNRDIERFKRLVREIINSKSISKKCRPALIMQYQKEFSLAEIAHVMKTEYQSANNQAMRCRDKFRKAINEVFNTNTFFREMIGLRKK
jgi:RNA polymerase sigma factor (sigma-70 family)